MESSGSIASLGPTTIEIEHEYDRPLSAWERCHGAANRFIYSKFYQALYAIMALISLVTVIISLKEGGCPGPFLIALEVIVNLVMIAEVNVRLVAMGKFYWQSLSNVIDIFLVVFCIITLVVLAAGCTSGSTGEEIVDIVLLVIWNGIQFLRLFMMLWKNQHAKRLRDMKVVFSDQPRRQARDVESDNTPFIDNNDQSFSFLEEDDLDR